MSGGGGGGYVLEPFLRYELYCLTPINVSKYLCPQGGGGGGGPAVRILLSCRCTKDVY